MRREFLIILFITPLFLFAQAIDEVFNTFLENEQIKSAHIGFYVENITNDSLIISHQEEKLFVPASVVKIITTDIALSILGDDFTFKTDVVIESNTQNGVLNDNLIIYGGGDPTLASERFDGVLDLDELVIKIFQAVQNKGISQINGRVIVDDAIFDNNPPQSWAWEDIANYYGAAAQGLSFQENKYKLTFQQGKEGKTPKIIKIEPSQNLTFDNQVLSDSPNSGDQAYIMGAPFSKERVVIGTIPSGTGTFTIKGAMPETAPIFEEILTTYFNKNGITIKQEKINPPHALVSDTILSIESPTLLKIAEITNHQSINLYAEHLLKMIGFAIKGKGTTENGIETIEEYISKKTLLDNGFQLKDGSGLSRKNLLSPKFIAIWLKQSHKKEAFLESLPTAGISGTMKYFNSTKIKGKIHAKSGSADGIINYAGYIKKDNGDVLSFAFFVNNYSGSRQQLRREMVKVIGSLL